MKQQQDWQSAARLMKSRIQTFATVVTWYASLVTASLLADGKALTLLQQNQIAGTALIIGILAAGFLGGEWITRLICSDLPDPDAA